MKVRFPAFAKCQQGTVAVEFAVVGGLAVFVLLGSVEYATWVKDQRAVASASTAAAQSIADSGSSTAASRKELETALDLMRGPSNTEFGLNVYNVNSDDDGKVEIANKWSTGSPAMIASASAADWEIIKPHLTADEGGVVACAFRRHKWKFLPVTQGSGVVVKSCNAAVPVNVPTIDWQ